jgi:hypothetical protein
MDDNNVPEIVEQNKDILESDDQAQNMSTGTPGDELSETLTGLTSMRERSEILLNFALDTYYNSDLGFSKYLSLEPTSDTLKIPLTNACLFVMLVYTLVATSDEFENKTYAIADEEKVEVSTKLKKLAFKHSKTLFNYIEQQFLNRSLDGKDTPLEYIRKRIQEVRMKHNITEELILLSMLRNDINHKRIKSIIKSYKDIIQEKSTKDVSFLKQNKKYANLLNININGGCGLPDHIIVSDRINDAIRYFLYDLVYRTTLSNHDIQTGINLRGGDGEINLDTIQAAIPDTVPENIVPASDANGNNETNNVDDIENDAEEAPKEDPSGIKSSTDFNEDVLTDFIENYIVSVIEGFKNKVKHNDSAPYNYFDMEKILEDKDGTLIGEKIPIFKVLSAECEDIFQDAVKTNLKEQEKRIMTNIKTLTKEQIEKLINLLYEANEDASKRKIQVKKITTILTLETIDNNLDSLLDNEDNSSDEELNNYFYDLFSIEETNINKFVSEKNYIMSAVSAFKFNEEDVIKSNRDDLLVNIHLTMVRNIEKYIRDKLEKQLSKLLLKEKTKSLTGSGKKQRKTITKRKRKSKSKTKTQKKRTKKH